MDKIALTFSPKKPTFDDLQCHGTELSTDWSGARITNLSKFLFWVDDTSFHFLAGQNGSPGLSHPDSKLEEYCPELWKYDVAEFFLLASDKSRYLEFNLAPNGAWWSSAFTSLRVPAPGEPTPAPEVKTSAEVDTQGWRAHASMPLSWLKKQYGFSELSLLNATFILNSPDQIFVTAGDLGDGEPDFHRPHRFPAIKPVSLPHA